MLPSCVICGGTRHRPALEIFLHWRVKQEVHGPSLDCYATLNRSLKSSDFGKAASMLISEVGQANIMVHS